MQGDILSLICRLTPSKPFTDTLKPEILTSFKQTIRSDKELIIPVYSFLQQRGKSSSSQVRFLVFQLINYLFCRSSHFRSLFCKSYVLPFIDLFQTDLPPPDGMASRLKIIVPIILSQWSTKYGKTYPQLNILIKEVKPRLTKEEQIHLNQASKLSDLVDVFDLRYCLFFREMQNILDLTDREKNNFVMMSEEYEEIVINLLKERKKRIEECQRDADVLVAVMNQYTVDTALKERVGKAAQMINAIEQAAIQFGINNEMFEDASENDDDGFVDQNDDDD